MAESDSNHSLRAEGGCVISSPSGLSLRAIPFGCIVTHLLVADRDGRLADVVLGFDDDERYRGAHPYFGAVAGRVAGRISGGRFTLDGRAYPLAVNDPPNHLHGGERGFDKHDWTVELQTPSSVRFRRTSPDGEEGYPGNVDARVTYAVSGDSEFIVDFEAVTDAPTPLSLTHHSYFNLAGASSSQSVESHALEIFADDYAPADSAMGLIGKREPVIADNDFRQPRTLADAIPHLHAGHGDLYFTLAHPTVTAPIRAARLSHRDTGRVMEVFTTEPCIQLYTGVGLDGSIVGKSGRAYATHAGLCLECEGYPDGANHPQIGEIILRPGQRYFRRTVYAFSTLK